MIRDMKGEAPDAQTFAQLEVSEMTFHLTGSRFMGGARPDSDWDFAVQWSGLAIDKLLAMGFLAMSGRREDDYEDADSLTVVVMQKLDSGHVIQVQLTRDLSVKLLVRDIISQHLFADHLRAGKIARAFIWETLGEVVKHARKRTAPALIPF